MFCPQCGAHQTEGKKFCTTCGFNLVVISQAMTGRLQPVHPATAGPDPRELQRQREMAKGVKLTIIGGAFVAMQFFSLIFTMPFRGDGPNFFWMFISLVVVGVGVCTSKAPRSSTPAPACTASRQ